MAEEKGDKREPKDTSNKQKKNKKSDKNDKSLPAPPTVDKKGNVIPAKVGDAGDESHDKENTAKPGSSQTGTAPGGSPHKSHSAPDADYLQKVVATVLKTMAKPNGENVETHTHDVSDSDSDIDVRKILEDGEKEEGEDDWLDEFDQDLTSQDEVGPDLSEKIAKIVNKVLKRRLPEEKGKALMEKFKRPGNVEMLTHPPVNDNVWKTLKNGTRTQDLKFQHISEKLIKFIIASSELSDKLHSLTESVPSGAQKKLQDVTIQSLEVLKVGAMTLHELNQKRRDNMRYDLNDSCRALCKPPKEEGPVLFGEDLQDKVNELTVAQKMGRQLADNFRYDKKSFLGGKRSQPYKKGDRRQNYRQNQARDMRERRQDYHRRNYQGKNHRKDNRN